MNPPSPETAPWSWRPPVVIDSPSEPPLSTPGNDPSNLNRTDRDNSSIRVPNKRLQAPNQDFVFSTEIRVGDWVRVSEVVR